MFKPIRWKTLPRDFAIIQIGFALFGIAIAMLIHANLGTNPWVMLTVALANRFTLSVGTWTMIVGLTVLAIAVAMRERIGWGTLGNILFIGPWTDLFLWLIPSVTDNWPLQIGMLLIAIFIIGMATGIYIGVDAGAGPRDTLMLAVQQKTGWSLRRSRSTIELCVFVAGWLLGGPFGIGTIIIALLVGPAVQLGFRAFHPQKPQNQEVERVRA